MVGNIQDPDYETVTAVCTHCESLCVFNRMDDIGEPGPYDRRYVTCSECRQQFWIFGDIINPAYDLLISSAGEHFGTKRYMQCIALLAQAWEIFFSAYAYSNYIYRPYFASPPTVDRSAEFLNELGSQLSDALHNRTFYPLRDILTNTVLKRVHPQTLRESEASISRITSERFDRSPEKADIETFPDAKMSDLLKQLQRLEIAELRNKVVHHRAHRPRRVEVEKCLEDEIKLLRHAERLLPVRDFDRWRAITSAQQRKG